MARYYPEVYRCAAATFTRPSDTTQYTAGDVIGPVTTPAVQTIAKASRYSQSGGKILNVSVSKSTSTVTLFTVRVHFYNDDPTPIADNSAWTLLHSDVSKYIGYRDLDIAISPGSGNGAVAQMAATHMPLPFVTATSSSGNLYAVIAAVGAYTPASAETFALTVTVERD